MGSLLIFSSTIETRNVADNKTTSFFVNQRRKSNNEEKFLLHGEKKICFMKNGLKVRRCTYFPSFLSRAHHKKSNL